MAMCSCCMPYNIFKLFSEEGGRRRRSTCNGRFASYALCSFVLAGKTEYHIVSQNGVSGEPLITIRELKWLQFADQKRPQFSAVHDPLQTMNYSLHVVLCIKRNDCNLDFWCLFHSVLLISCSLPLSGVALFL